MAHFDSEGNRRQSQKQPADQRLAFRPPGSLCNARLARQDGYCTNAAGEGTDHVGYGRCKLHGGITKGRSDSPDGPLGMWRAAGLEQIINMAETMTRDDSEYITYVGNNALSVLRAKIVADLNAPGNSPKEMADLTMALTRVDKILAKFPDEDKPDVGIQSSTADEEARLDELESNIIPIKKSG